MSVVCRETARSGCDLYENLFNRNINIIFLKEQHINTEVYRQALQNQIDIKLQTGNQATDNLMNTIIDALNTYSLELAKEQIRIAFDQAEKEVKDLHQRTKERDTYGETGRQTNWESTWNQD